MNLLEIDDVWVVFDTQSGRVESLRGITLSLRRGEWMAIVGHNGSGKSTLGRVIGGLCGISKGKVSSSPSVRIVFQNPDAQAIGDTVMEDVLFQPGLALESNTVFATELDATSGQSEDYLATQASHALSLVNLLEVRNQAVETLSGGQKQRLAIASAIVAKPDILVLDEVTTMLDDAHRQQVWDAVRQLHEDGVCVVWITQHMDEVFLADVVAVIDGGTVSYMGEPRDFFYPRRSEAQSDVELQSELQSESKSEFESRLESQSVCERMGFTPPPAVAVARELSTALSPTDRPVTVDELLEAIDACRSS